MRLDYAFFADAAIRRHDGKMNAIGLIDGLLSQYVDLHPQRLALIICLRPESDDIETTSLLTVTMIPPDKTDEARVVQESVSISSNWSLGRRLLKLYPANFQEGELSVPGDYIFKVYLAGECLGEIVLPVGLEVPSAD